MKILIYSPTLSYCIWGTERVVIEQIKWFITLWHTVGVITTWSYNKSSIYNDLLLWLGAEIFLYKIIYSKDQMNLLGEYINWDWERIYKESILFAKNANEIFSKIAKDYDLVITHMALDSLFIPESIPNILHLHWHPSKKIEELTKAIQKPKWFIAVSNSVASRRSNNYEIKNIKTCQNGIDINKFKPWSWLRDIDVLFVWRLVENKWINDILKAYDSRWKMTMVWDWPLKWTIQEYAKGKNIVFLSNITDDHLLSLYQRSKVFVCPSTDKEGVLTTMLEAASSWCAVVTTNCCWMVDFAVNGKNSLVVEPFDFDELHLAIEKLLYNFELRYTLVNNSIKDLNNKRSRNKKIKEIENFYLWFIS